MTVHARRGHRLRDTEQSSIFFESVRYRYIYIYIYESNTIIYPKTKSGTEMREVYRGGGGGGGFVYSEFSRVLNFRVLRREKGVNL